MLTDAKAKAAKYEGKDRKVSDSGGLYLHVKKGGKYWRLKYRFAGKEKLLSIGKYPDISLAKARKARDHAKDQLSEGIDPSAAKQQEKLKQQLQNDNTVRGVANELLEKQSSNLAPVTIKRKRQLLANEIFPLLASRPVDQVETYELVNCITSVDKKGYRESAQKTRELLNQIFTYAKQTGRIKHNPASDLQGCITPHTPVHRAALITPNDFGKLLVDIDNYQGTLTVKIGLQLCALVFQRPGEVCSMKWSEINFDECIWQIPREKLKQRNQSHIDGDHIVPLSKQAIALLNEIKPLTGHRDYVFTNQKDHARHIPTESLNKGIKRLGYDTKTQHTPHGFRASARTLLVEQLQIPTEWIEQQLGHKVSDALGRAYNRTKHLPQRKEMMQRWADYCDQLKLSSVSGNVVTGSFGSVIL